MLNVRLNLRNVVKKVACLAESKVNLIMEPETICKNGANSKSQMSRVNQLMN